MSSIRCWTASHVGKVRKRNEDSYAIAGVDMLPGSASWQGDLDPAGTWALVSDGMGGHPAGDVASKLAVACMGTLLSQSDPTLPLSSYLEATDDAMRHAMSIQPSLKGMGATIVGMVVRDDQITTFNVGDSRAYLFTDRRDWQISKDHSDGHMLTLCLGGTVIERPLEPDEFQHKAVPGSRILLCSDGLTNFVSDREIRSLIFDDTDPAAALISAALEAGGYDNVTVVVAAFD